ncbi:hypothetical protein PTKIN_Ptkin06aG0195100 [Pterospermum kingtungense]
MAGYGYGYRGGYTTYNGVTPPTEGWTKTSYASSDHARQPVILDAEGRRKPMVSYTPNGKSEYYVTQTEIVEHVPLVVGYKQSNPVRVEVIRDYGDHHVDGKWNNRPSSPEKWGKSSSSPVPYHADQEKWNRRPTSPVHYRTDDKWNKPSSPEKWGRSSSPVRYHVEEKWNRPTSPVHYRAEEKWNRPISPVHDRPQHVEEFITKIQTQASQHPSKFAPLSTSQWRETPNFSPPVNTGYGDRQGDLSHKQWQKPSVNTILDPTPKPSHGSWSKGQGPNLSQPTSDINMAMQYLTQAAKPSPTRNTYPDTIDSREAQRRYGGLSVSPRPVDNYTRTIDSREAARKYGGTAV